MEGKSLLRKQQNASKVKGEQYVGGTSREGGRKLSLSHSPLRPHVPKRRLTSPAVCELAKEVVHENPQVEEIVKVFFYPSLVRLNIQRHLYLSYCFHFLLLAHGV